MTVTVKNPTDGLILVGESYLFPGESKAVHPAIARQAQATNPALLIDGQAAVVVVPVTIAPSATPLAGEPEDIEDEPADEAEDTEDTKPLVVEEDVDLEAMTKAELAVTAEGLGLEVGRKATKGQLIEMIQTG